jgi:hypothetical protein
MLYSAATLDARTSFISVRLGMSVGVGTVTSYVLLHVHFELTVGGQYDASSHVSLIPGVLYQKCEVAGTTCMLVSKRQKARGP